MSGILACGIPNRGFERITGGTTGGTTGGAIQQISCAAAVPAPGSLALLGLGIAGALAGPALVRRRQRMGAMPRRVVIN